MNPLLQQQLQATRRQFFGRSASGIGLAALSTLLGEDLLGENSAAASQSNSAGIGALPGLPHFAPKARRVIYLMQSGAPSHVDLFDYKPGLARMHGQQLPESVHMGQRLTTMTQGKPQPILPGIAPFRRHGECGRWISDFLPHTA